MKQKKAITVHMQVITKALPLPSKKDFSRWVNTVLPSYFQRGEIGIRLIDEAESQALNFQYRHKNHPTNILSFSYLHDRFPGSKLLYLGDLAICAPIVNYEAKEHHLAYLERWAHIVIHGCLHLAGFKHENEEEAHLMETQESQFLMSLGYHNPYATESSDESQ